jgi:hypothetical protein
MERSHVVVDKDLIEARMKATGIKARTSAVELA